jgi:hypothetical protein
MRVLAVLVLMGVLGCYDDEQVERNYPTKGAAAGAIRQGHVPRCLPASVTGMTVLTDLDLNSSYGRFSFARADLSYFDTLTRVAPRELSSTRVVLPRSEEWWPRSLTGLLNGKTLSSSSMRFYECPIDARHTAFSKFVLAIDNREAVGFFWTM